MFTQITGTAKKIQIGTLYGSIQIHFIPFFVDCFADNFKLEYNVSSKSANLPPGVSIRTIDYGNISSVEYLDVQKTVPAWHLVTDLLIKLGYEPGVNLRAAPYDWRLGPNTNFGDSFFKLQKLIEETYYINSNRSVVVTSLSMGGGYLLAFLNSMNQAWKDKYIHSFVPISSCFGGSMWAPTVLLGGDVGLGGAINMNFVQNFESILWLSPYNFIGDTETALFSTPTKQYRARDMVELFKDASLNLTAMDMENLIKYQDLSPPNVKVNCIFGTEVDTLGTVSFSTQNFFGGPSTNTTTKGDGTCSHASLNLCETWSQSQSYPAITTPIPGMIHADGLMNPLAVRALVEALIS